MTDLTYQEETILQIIKESGSVDVDHLYNEVFRRRIISDKFIIKNILKRLESFNLIKIENNRVYVV
jgi:hypothetical protein